MAALAGDALEGTIGELSKLEACLYLATARCIGAVTLQAEAIVLALIVFLSLRLRQREFQTLYRIGCARLTVARIFTAELALILTAGAVSAWLLSIPLAGWLESWVLS